MGKHMFMFLFLEVILGQCSIFFLHENLKEPEVFPCFKRIMKSSTDLNGIEVS